MKNTDYDSEKLNESSHSKMGSRDYLLKNGSHPPYGAVCDLNQKEKKIAKLRIIKNLIAISFGFMLLFIATLSILDLQSSINPKDGLGTTSLAVAYAVNIISCLFLPPYLIERFGCKYTFAMAILTYSIYIASNFYAQWYTLIPAAAIQGLGGGPLWSSASTYVTEIANQYAALVDETSEVFVTRFFSVFFMFYQSAQIWGNLISANVLKPNYNTTGTGNDADILALCGINFSNEESIKGGNTANKNLERPSNNKLYTLCGIYIGCALCAALFSLLFMGQLKQAAKEEEGTKSGVSKPSLKLLVKTFRHLRNPQQILLIPLTIYTGMELAFLASDYTKAYISCAWGIHNVGTVMIFFGICNTISSFILGPLAKVFPRSAIFAFGTLINLTMVVTMFLWHPNLKEKALFFVIAGLWGVADAIWQSRINSLYGVLFKDNKEAAFANCRLWQSIGYSISFLCSSHIGIRAQLYILITFLTVGITCYGIIEVKVKRQKKS